MSVQRFPVLNRIRHIPQLFPVVAGIIAITGTSSLHASDKVATRRFQFHYRVTITDLPKGKPVDVWIPLADSDDHQTVKVRRISLPGKYRKTKDAVYGNQMIYLRTTAGADGRVPIAIDYTVERKAVSPKTGVKVTKSDRKKYLQSNRLVPLRGKPFKLLLGNRYLGKTRADVRTIYDRVDRHVRYHNPAGGKWGRGDVDWVCDSRHGNCSDFHSLFISLCRTNGVPARFQIGFPIGKAAKGKVGGYHCWAEFADGKRWFPVDISEADKNPKLKDYYFGNLPPDRVRFTTGRDLKLQPRQKSGPLNFFVYPHVEVDGKRHTKMRNEFAWSSAADRPAGK